MKIKLPQTSVLSKNIKTKKSWFYLFLYIIIVMALITYPHSSNEMTFNAPNSDGVTFNNITIAIIASFIFSFVLVSFLGFTLLMPFFNNIKTTLFSKLISSFFIGWIASTAIIRVVSLLFTYSQVYIPSVIIMLIIIGIFGYLNKPSNKQLYQDQILKPNIKNILITLLSFSAIFILISIYEIHTSQYHWVGHGQGYYPAFIKGLEKGGYLYFPIIKGHYGELIFTYFLINPFRIDFNSIIPMWLTLGLIKISTGYFLFFVLQKFKFNKIQSVIFSGFFLIGTTSILPTRYFLLYDASNPIFMTTHAGRIVGIGLSILFILQFLQPDKYKFSYIFYILIAIGITTTSISNGVWIVFIIIISFLIRFFISLLKNKPRAIKKTSKHLNRIIIASLTSMFLIFVHSHTNNFSYTIKLLLTLLPLLLFIPLLKQIPYKKTIKKWQQLFSKKQKLPVIKFIIFLFFLCISYLTFGNILYSKFANRYFFPKIRTEVVRDYPIHSTATKLADFRINKYRVPENDRENQFEWERGIGYFFAYFGLLYFMWLRFYYYFKKRFSNKSTSEKERYAFFLFSSFLSLLPIIFFFISFTNFVSPVGWLKSRFLELPIYMLYLLFFFFLSKYETKKNRVIATIIIALYSIVPFITTNRFLQIFENSKILLTLLFK